jgi:hypothetical protein
MGLTSVPCHLAGLLAAKDIVHEMPVRSVNYLTESMKHRS